MLRFGRIMKYSTGQKTAFTNLAKVNFDEIWSTVSTLLVAGPGRFWAWSAQ